MYSKQFLLFFGYNYQTSHTLHPAKFYKMIFAFNKSKLEKMALSPNLLNRGPGHWPLNSLFKTTFLLIIFFPKQSGMTPLFCSADNGDLKTCELLLKHNANVNSTTKVFSMLLLFRCHHYYYFSLSLSLLSSPSSSPPLS